MKAIKERRIDYYFSKILLQINNKLGGFNYFLNTDKMIDDRNIILIGVSANHILGSNSEIYNGNITGLAMVSTKDKNFSKFYSKGEIINNDFHYSSTSRRSIANFIEEAFEQYKKENKGVPPKNIIIYRQGISHNQLSKIKLEALDIQETCKKLNIQYYYVIVNTRTTIKFFEYHKLHSNNRSTPRYSNPEQGLIILDQIVHSNIFEFFIQPNKVNVGCATPTYFKVPYGNMGFPELLIKLTYWTSFIYPNYQNPIRIPHVLKMAEKLSNMIVKFTHSTLNENLSDKQSFL